MASRTLNPHPGNFEVIPTRSPTLECAAREALSTRTGRVLTDTEWARARTRLLEFVTILRVWNEKANTPASGLGNVV